MLEATGVNDNGKRSRLPSPDDAIEPSSTMPDAPSQENIEMKQAIKQRVKEKKAENQAKSKPQTNSKGKKAAAK